MPHPVTARIADGITAGLVHPGNPHQPAKLISLPGLASTGIPPEMAQHFTREAGFPTNDAPQVIAEAVVALIETDHEIVPRTELDELRTQAALPDTGSTITVRCRCNQPLLEITAGRARTTVDGRKLAARIAEVCTC